MSLLTQVKCRGDLEGGRMRRERGGWGLREERRKKKDSRSEMARADANKNCQHSKTVFAKPPLKYWQYLQNCHHYSDNHGSSISVDERAP